MTKRGLSSFLPTSLVRRIERLPRLARWALRELPRDPGMELYARREDMRNRAYFLSGQGDGTDLWRQDIPRIVWIFWAQGLEDAPALIHRCIASWREMNPGWDVRVLDQTTAQDHVDMSDLPDNLPLRYRANLLRIRLLNAHGGVWADATLLCHRPLDDWLPLQAQAGFTAFGNPGPDRFLDNWFLVSVPGHPLVAAWADSYAAYVRRLTYKPDKYFMMMYVLQWRLKRDPVARAAWRRAALLPAPPTFVLADVIDKGGEGLDDVRGLIARGLPVSKLSRKTKVPAETVDAVLDNLSAD